MSALKTTVLQRVFKYEAKKGDSITLPDPNPAMSPDEVMDHYSSEYPELTNCVITGGDEKDGAVEYSIKNNFGPKG